MRQALVRVTLLSLLLLTQALAADDSSLEDEAGDEKIKEPSDTGKFFYMGFRNGDHYGQHFIDMKLGSNEQPMNIWLSTYHHSLAFVSTSCEACNTPTKYNQGQSNNYVRLSDTSSTAFGRLLQK